MHSKATVFYVCQYYVYTGLKLYYKRELITTDSFRNLDSVYWSRPRPVSERTFKKAQKEGYKCEIARIYTLPGDVILLSGVQRSGRRTKARITRNHCRSRNAYLRLLQR